MVDRTTIGETGAGDGPMTPLVAWLASTEAIDEFDSEIVFAASADAAVDLAARVLDVASECVAVRRERWADVYAPGPVPLLALVDHGWRFECAGCYTAISADREDEDGGALDLVEHRGRLYCTPACRDRDVADRHERRDTEAAAIDAFRALIEAALPGAAFQRGHAFAVRRANGELEIVQVVIDFRFPGGTLGDAQFRFDSERGDRAAGGVRVMVPAGDVAAFDAWRRGSSS